MIDESVSVSESVFFVAYISFIGISVILHIGASLLVATSLFCELDQTLFAQDAYIESKNAPARKIGSGYTKLPKHPP